MSKRTTNGAAVDNIGIALAALMTARAALFHGTASVHSARKLRRIREVEWAVCDAIKTAERYVD